MRNWQRLLEQFLKLKPSVQLVLALCFLVLIIGAIIIIIMVGFNPMLGLSLPRLSLVSSFFSHEEVPPANKDADD